MSIYHGLTDNYNGIDIKRGTASAFQANFDSDHPDVEETDPGSVHMSHYRYYNTYVCSYVVTC